MTFFFNNKVGFFNLFNGKFTKQTDKQVGKISNAIKALDKINESISVSLSKDDNKISKLRKGAAKKDAVRTDNRRLLESLNHIRKF